MAQITVKAKGDLGFHLFHGQIIQGGSYTMEEEQWSEQLFERPSPEWRAPGEAEPITVAPPVMTGNKITGKGGNE